MPCTDPARRKSMKLLVILVLAIATAACQAPQMPPAVPPAPSTPPPPPPERDVNAVTVHGRVTSPLGHPVARALVTVRTADASCRPLGIDISGPTDDNGQYAIEVEGNAGPAHQGCVLVEARSGGATATANAPAYYTSSKTARQPVQVDVQLPTAQLLTAAESERLVNFLVDAINNPAGVAAGELALYVNYGEEALRVAVEQYRELLGTVTNVRPVEPEEWYRNTAHYSFELRGSNGKTSRVDVRQEGLIRLHSLLLTYGMRSQAFVMAYIRAIASGDAVRLAQILNPDDVDFPVERAREMTISYRQRYDTATIRPEFVGVDEKRGQITWRLRGKNASGTEVTETITLQTGDGLIGVVGL